MIKEVVVFKPDIQLRFETQYLCLKNTHLLLLLNSHAQKLLIAFTSAIPSRINLGVVFWLLRDYAVRAAELHF